MLSSSSRDNWERLVSAVVKREQIWQLCHKPYSRSPSTSTTSSDTPSNLSRQFLNYSSLEVELEHIFLSSSRPQLPQPEPSVSQEDLPIHLEEARRFSLQELRIATWNFSNKVKYGYHTVYRGCLADGSLVEIKRYRNSSFDNHSAILQFKNNKEINSIAAHPHVLHMLGVCFTPKESFLVYPWMENRSIASCLRGRHKSDHPLNWVRRKRIALGVAWGLTHMHYGCHKKIIHRDLKAANIFLNDDWEAVIADLGLAVIMNSNATHINTSIVGTIGHMAPEYLSSGTCSEKTDVFGYGVFLLELVTGQRTFDLIRLANDEDVMLLDWIKRDFIERNWELIVDPDCKGDHMEEVVEQLMQIAMLCTHSNPVARPKMSMVVEMLEDGNHCFMRWEKLYKKHIQK